MLRHLLALDRRAAADLLRAQVAILVAHARCLLERKGALVSAHDAAGDAAPASAGTSRPGPRAFEIAEAVDIVARRGVTRPQCLVRSMALRRLLEREGVQDVRLRVGVRRTERGFAAHAWVEAGGVIVGDAAGHVRSFAPVAVTVRSDR